MIVVVGASHKTAPIAVRERITVSRTQLPALLTSLHTLDEIQHVCVVSTCNRVEVYAVPAPTRGNNPSRVSDAIERVLLAPSSPSPDVRWSQHLFRFDDHAAVHHLFRVASSLDSLVIGEAQVLGQVKDAYDAAIAAGTLGSLLSRAIEWSFHTAKRVRSETHIGQGYVSVSSVAVHLARQIFRNLDQHTVALIGAGTMGEAAAQHLHSAGAKLIVVNRNPDRATSLATRFDGTAREWDHLAETLAEADVVIASTSSHEFLLTPALIAPLMKNRQGRALFIIDIAVPRNADPQLHRIDGVHLHDIDDLSKIASETAQDRRKEAALAENIIAQEAQAFTAWADAQKVTPTIVALRNQVRSVLESELDRTLHSKLKHLSETDRKALIGMVSAQVNKLTHHPTTRLKEAAADGNARHVVSALRELFDIHPEDTA